MVVTKVVKMVGLIVVDSVVKMSDLVFVINLKKNVGFVCYGQCGKKVKSLIFAHLLYVRPNL